MNVHTDSILRKFSKRFMFIFNDVIIVCSKKESAEFYEVQQVLYGVRVVYFVILRTGAV